jgi:predicted permease
MRRLINAFRRERLERELDAELRAHIQLDIDRNLRAGMPPAEARRVAHARLGGVEQVKERWREARPFYWFGPWWLDVKLGLRMLVKHPGLTCVSVFALAIGIPVGLAPTHLIHVAIETPLPVDDGDRIRLLRHRDVANVSTGSTSLYDFTRWSEALTTFDALGALRSSYYNVDSVDGSVPPVVGAEVTASSFDMLRVPPLRGRALVAADEVIGAPLVVVIGHDFWRSRLAADPHVVGRIIDIGRVAHTVVGVMPEEFLFPVRHQLWLPLRERHADEPGQGLGLTVFGRLADGISEDAAQAELDTLGRRAAAEFPDTHARLRPEVLPFSFTFFGFEKGFFDGMEVRLVQLFSLVLLVVACSNVGMLIFARTATRTQEFAVRTALGASRARIVSQVFTESLVLALSAAGVGLLIVDWLPSLLPTVVADSLPYWVDLGVTRRTVAWALSLAVFSGAVAGVVPALQATGRAVNPRMQRSAAGRSGLRFGGVTSVLVAADVAIAVAVVGFAAGISVFLSEARDASGIAGIKADQFLSVRLDFPVTEAEAEWGASDRSDFIERAAVTQQALVQRLRTEPGVRAVAVANALPRMQHRTRPIEVEGEQLANAARGHWVRTARVDVGFFEALEQPVLVGRGFTAADLGDDRSAVIVNTPFVDQLLGGRNPIGARFRDHTPVGTAPGSWFEIVGVVGPLGMNVPRPAAGFYQPGAPGEIHPLRLAIQLGDDPASFTPRVRSLAAEIDPVAVLSTPVALDEVVTEDWYLGVAQGIGALMLVGLLLVLAASGIYAIMSFAVAERTREIGIRTALGAHRSRIAFTVLRRALAQLAVGLFVGMPVARLFILELQSGGTYQASVVSFFLGLGLVVLIGLLACTAPTLRALRIMPTEALREG